MVSMGVASGDNEFGECDEVYVDGNYTNLILYTYVQHI